MARSIHDSILHRENLTTSFAHAPHVSGFQYDARDTRCADSVQPVTVPEHNANLGAAEVMGYSDPTSTKFPFYDAISEAETQINSERESDYKPPKTSARYVDYGWTTTKDIPCDRLRLVVYAPYRGVSWSMSFQESKDRTLTTDIPKMVKSIENSTEVLVEKVKEEERQAELRRQEWEGPAGILSLMEDTR